MHELVSVAPDGAELFVGGRVVRVDGLTPDRDYEIGEVSFRTLADPGAVRVVFTTANDVHFGETVCGQIDGHDGPDVFRVGEGETPYPEVMNAAVIADMVTVAPAAVVVKGDLTDDGVTDDYARFLDVWGDAFGARLLHVRGNHDCYRGQTYAAWPCQARVLDGVTLALLDTARPYEVGGALDAEQLDWLDDLGASSGQPVVVLGHHPVFNPATDHTRATVPGLSQGDSARLVQVLRRRTNLQCYLAGHTHRNLRRTVDGVPCVEVACVKDFPGAWAEYRVCERGIVQVFHRASAPAAVAWAERTRQMFAGYYAPYAMGSLEDRSFVVATDGY